MLSRLLFALLLLAGFSAQAVDHSKHTVGVGVLTQMSGTDGRPAQLSAKFPLSEQMEISALLGLSFAGDTIFTPGVKGAWVLVPEKYMNLYGAATLSVDVRTRGGLAGLAWQIGPGVELFLPEWPNLGLALEFGLGGTLRAGSRQSDGGTNYSGFGGAGIHYYF